MGSIADFLSGAKSAVGATFNAQEFYTSILNSIDAIRSQYSLNESTIAADTTKLTGGQKQAESRLNAFLRALGMPATRFAGTLDQRMESLLTENKNIEQYADEIKTQFGTFNYFTTSVDLSQSINDRERLLTKERTPKDYTLMLYAPLDIDCSARASSVRATRPSLFPLICSADVPIFPVRNRIAPIFFDGDYTIDGKTRCSRPFIEQVIYMREFTGELSEIKQSYISSIMQTISGSNSPITQAELQNSTLIQLQARDKILMAMKWAAEDYRKVRDQITRYLKDVEFVPEVKSNPAEKSGFAEGQSASELLKDEPNFKDSTVFSATKDQELRDLKAALAVIDFTASLSANEQVKTSDNLRRIGSDISISNITPDIFVSEFILVSSFERDIINQRISALTEERAKIMQQLEILKQKVMMYTGEMTGLSIFDILSIFLAFFTVDMSVLYGLLNKKAIENLNNNSFFTSRTSGSTTQTNTKEIISEEFDLAFALAEFEDEVKKNINLAQSFYTNASKTGDTNQK